MVKRSSLDPIAEAQARVKLRYTKAKPVHPGPATIARSAMRVTRKALPEKAVPLSRLKLNWEDVVGAQLARLCRPEKLAPTRGGRSLTLKVIPAAAGLVQHQSEMIRQRVSMSLGGDIVKIKLIQGPLSARDPNARLKAQKVELSPEELAALQSEASRIDDPALRAAIVALGEAVLSDTSED